MALPRDTDADAIEKVAGAAHPLSCTGDDAELRPLLAAMASSQRSRPTQPQFVLLGEATHGTHEFYTLRAAITKRLVEDHGFSVVLVEGDWPAAQRVNRYLGSMGTSMDRTAEQSLDGFQGFPRWMWRNGCISRLVDDLKAHNERVARAQSDRDAALDARDAMQAAGATEEQMRAAGLLSRAEADTIAASAGAQVSFHGVDVYSVWRSSRAVIEFLEIVDPDAAERARDAYAVFEPFGEAGLKEYGMQATLGELAPRSAEIQQALLQTLADLQRANRELYSTMVPPAELLDAEVNAEVVINGEAYFRGLYTDGSVATWNLRDQHMVQTCMRLVEHHTSVAYGAPPRVVLWAHNSHVGDASATEREEWNLGQMLRSTFGASNVFICGFGTFTGEVTAAREWGDEPETFPLSPAEEGSLSHVLHRALPAVRARLVTDGGEPASSDGSETANALALLLRGDDDTERQAVLRAALSQPRRQRAVGVCYRRGAQEASAHYFQATLAEQVDCWVHVDRTTALQPLRAAVP